MHKLQECQKMINHVVVIRDDLVGRSSVGTVYMYTRPKKKNFVPLGDHRRIGSNVKNEQCIENINVILRIWSWEIENVALIAVCYGDN